MTSPIPVRLAMFGLAGAAWIPTIQEDRGIVRRVDHVIIKAANAATIFAFLNETLALPEAWPMEAHGGAFTSGGVFAGNVTLELLESGADDSGSDAHLLGIAFEPAAPIATTVAQLDELEIPHGPAMPFRGTKSDGSLGTLWTSVFVRGLMQASTWMFVCEYAWDVDERRVPLIQELEASAGGPLGIVGVGEIVVGVLDSTEAMDRWRPFLGEPVRDELSFGFEEGPSIRLIESEVSAIEAIVLEVTSLEAAKRFLAHRNALRMEGELVLIESSAVGVRIFLEEAGG